jgi:nicotinamide-nucleotide amidase
MSDVPVLAPLAELGERVGSRLRQRGDTVAIAESSAGGLISAALLAVPGASAFFLGGAVIYTKTARKELLGMSDAEIAGMQAETEPYAAFIGSRIRERHGATWGLGESGAAGPSGSRYGDAPGHVALAVAGPTARTLVVETGQADRRVNMDLFARRLLLLFDEVLAA